MEQGTIKPGPEGVTVRSVLLGVLLIPPNAYWVAQMELIRYQGHPTTTSLFFNCIFILLCLVLLNGLLRRIVPRVALDRRELLVIYIMLNIGSALVSHDMVQVLAPEMSHWAWYATPENRWEELFFRYIPRWLYRGDEGLLKGLYEGGDTLYRPQYLAAWGPPVLWWSAFLVALLLAMLCINALFRKRWMEREKLTYPITHLPLEMTQPGAPLFRDRWLWAGFAIAAGIDLLNGFHELWPAVPLIKVRVVHFDAYMRSVFVGHPWGALAGTRIGFYPFAVGLGLLLPTDLLFSCWFFYLVWRLEILLSSWFGWTQIPRFPFVEEQASAAYLGLGLFALWVSREHLRQLASRIVLGRASIDDRGEPMRYRLAAYGLLAGVGFVALFLGRMGLSWWIIPIFCGLYFLLSLSITRIRAELGPPVHDLHSGGPDQIIVNWFGTRASPLGPRNVTVLGLTWWFNRAYRSHPMPHQLEGYKMAQMTGMRATRLSVALMVAAVVGALSAFWALFHCFYKYGLEAEVSWAARGAFGPEPFVHIQNWLQNPEGTDWHAIVAMAAALGFTILLMALRMRFVWWPFHPVGYAISSSWAMNCLWVCLLIAWAVKLLALRYGGHKLFRSVIPFALGLILGEFIVGSIWTIIGISLGIDTYSFWV
jgi:hypothetical protein